MPKIALLNIKGEKVKDINLKEEVWGIVPNDSVLYDAILLARASLRQGTHKTKTRAEVRGGGKKPWAQKGTGRARQGSIRSVQWRGGGIAFGPQPRDYDKKMNRKERRLALRSALSYKVIDNNIIVLENMNLETPKTKTMLEFMKNLKVSDKTLFVTDGLEENVVLAARNINTIRLIEANEINVLDVVNANNIVITEEAVKMLEGVLS
jgi:large subunit ribosomal protein L4